MLPGLLAAHQPRLRQKVSHTRPACGQSAPNQLRQRQRLLGRILEYDRRRTSGVSNSDQAQLLRKIRRRPNFDQGKSDEDLKAEIEELTKAFQKERLGQWRSRLSASDKAMYKWLRHKPVPPSTNLCHQA